MLISVSVAPWCSSKRKGNISSLRSSLLFIEEEVLFRRNFTHGRKQLHPSSVCVCVWKGEGLSEILRREVWGRSEESPKTTELRPVQFMGHAG